MKQIEIVAVILDLDGTLLNTEKASSDVLKNYLAKFGKVVDREKEDRRLGMMHKESSAAVVKDYELPLTAEEFSEEIMPLYKEKWSQATPLPGANRLIRHLCEHGVPFALASNSKRQHIEMKISYQKGWKESFSVILGGDEVKSGKPSPDIFLEAAKRMSVDATRCLVIEDSVVGVTAAKNAGMKVVAVPSVLTQAHRYSIADCVLNSLLEFRLEQWGLPPFQDWVQGALPIDPMCIKGLISEGVTREGHTFFTIIANNSSLISLPDQVFGVYFGWAMLGDNAFKMIVSIGWDLRSGIAKRVIQACLIDEAREYISGEQLQLLVVGYIGQLSCEENKSEAFEILDDHKNIARSALDLSTFVHHRSCPILDEGRPLVDLCV